MIERIKSSGAAPRTVRPHPSILFVMALSLWCTTAFVYRVSAWLKPNLLCLILFVAIVFAVATMVFLSRKQSIQYAASIVLGLSLGVLSGGAAGAGMHDAIAQVSSEGSASYVFEILEDPQQSEYSFRSFAKTTLSDRREIIVQVSLPRENNLIRFGTRFSARTNLMIPSESSFEYLWERSAVATARISNFTKIERNDPLGAIIAFREDALGVFNNYETSGAALFRAVLFGERSSLNDNGFYNQIKAVGLAHMVAVSGAHLVIVSSLIGVLLRTLRLPRPFVVIIQMVCIGVYLVFTALPISALRAACMTIIALSSIFFRRRSSALNALAACIILIVVFSPADSLSLSFILSASSTIGIVVLGPLFRSWSLALIPRAPALFHESISLTFSAGIITIPLSAAYFSQISLVSPIMNIFAAPAFTLLSLGGFLAVFVGLALPALGGFVPIIITCSQAFCEFISIVSGIPYVALPVFCDKVLALLMGTSLLVALWARWPTLSLKAGIFGLAGSSIFFVLVVIIMPFRSGNEVIMLDVGQGDAFLIRSQGASVLIDTGTHDRELLESLGRQGVYKLDAVIISHADDDHCGSLLALREIVQVRQVCVAEALLDCECISCQKLLEESYQLVGEEGIVSLALGDKLKVGAFELSVLWPDKFTDKGGNADSLSLLLTLQQSENMSGEKSKREDPNLSSFKESFKALFCGDLEHDQLRTLIEEGKLSHITMLKVGHHGSKEALSEEVISNLRPEVALISVGATNRYGHPSSETLEFLDKVDCMVFRTDEVGDVVCKLEAEKLEVTTLR